MSAKIFVYLPAIIGVLSISLFVLLNNAKTLTNRFFAAANISVGLWLFFLMCADISADTTTALWFTRFALFFGQLMLLFFYFFALQFPYKTRYSTKRQIAYAVPMMILAVLLLTPLAVVSVSIDSAGVVISETDIIYAVSDVFSLGYLVFILGLIIGKYKKSNHTQKQQIKFLLIGGAITGVANFVANILLFDPTKGASTFAVLLTSLSILILSLLVAYSIIRHRLFDIRLVVARALAYVLSIAAVVSVYSAISFGIAASVFSTSVSVRQIIFFAVFSAVTALAFQPIKRFFDKATNRVFYRDAYDPQELLNKLNASLVSSSEINELLENSANIIEGSIRAQFVAFAVVDEETGVKYLKGTKVVKAAQAEDRLLMDYAKKTDDHTFLTDEITTSHGAVKRMLAKYQVAVTSKLIVGETTIGYLMLGDRKSGNAYSDRDIQLLETVADSVAIAAQNALRFEEISQFNITLQERIETATRNLQKTNEKLKALDEAKDEFISMASHQLRTPLTSVKGYISMVLEGDGGKVSPKQRKFLDQAYVSSQRMVYLIADLLNVSRLKTGKFVIEQKPVFMPDMVESEIAQLYQTAESRDLDLIFDKPKEFPMMNIDETKTRQVVMNFADNAIYYTPKGGRIVIRLKQTPQTVELTVTDDGIGVPKSEQHHLFTKFYRAGNAKQARPDGTGLGLFMAKKVIMAQGGAILFKTTEGKGSTFGFSLPRASLEIKPEK